MIAEALYALLTDQNNSGSVAIYTQLATYKTKPAVFTSPIPEDCAYPAIYIEEEGGPVGNEGTRDRKGYLVLAKVQVYGSQTYSLKSLRALAWSVTGLLNRASLSSYMSTYGFEDWGVQASPPHMTSDDKDYPGFTINVQARVLRTSAG